MTAPAGQQHYALRIPDWQGPQDELANQGKDGGIRADPDGQREDSHCREHRRLAEAAQSEADVPDNLREEVLVLPPAVALIVKARS